MTLAPHLVLCNSSYELLERRAGGIGTVWKALNLHLKKEVALKFLERADAAEIREALSSEGQKMAKVGVVRSPYIVYVNHFEPGDGDTPPLLELEWVDGGDLGEKIARLKPFPFEEIIRVALHITSALETAHRAGLIHCDLKPSNILYSATRDKYMLTDFGLSRNLNSLDSQRGMGGTLPYMSPEQFDDVGNVTEATDIYSLGCVLFQCCEGRPPIGAPDWRRKQFLDAHRGGDLPAAIRNPSIPPLLGDLIMRCMRRNPAARPTLGAIRQTVLEVAKSLGRRIETSSSMPMHYHSLRIDRKEGVDRYLHLACDLWFVRVAAGEGKASTSLLVPNRLLTSRDYLLFLQEPGSRSWKPTSIDAAFHDGGYLASWGGDLPPKKGESLVLASIPHAAAVAFCAWLGGRLPVQAELKHVLQGPECAELRMDIEKKRGDLPFLQFWCGEREDTTEGDATMLRCPDPTQLDPYLMELSRPPYFCFPHYVFLPVIPLESLGDFKILAADYAVEMETFIAQYLERTA